MNRNHLPQPLTSAEWDEIASLGIFELFLEDGPRNGDRLAEEFYGAKFDFMSSGPGFAGPLYVVVTDATAEGNYMFERPNGRIVQRRDDSYLGLGMRYGGQGHRGL